MLATAEALYRAGQADQAAELYREVLKADPHNPAALNNLANILKDRDQYDAAIEHYQKANDLQPSAGTFANLLYIYSDLRRDDEARACYRQALQLEPENLFAHYNASLWRLRNGDFENGWLEFEWRWKVNSGGYAAARFPRPRWIGQPLDGKTILLWGDQGAGDCIMFARFGAALKKLGAMTLLAAPQRFRKMLSLCRGIDNVVDEATEFAFDYHCPLSSLPAVLSITIPTIPRSVPYLLPDKERVNDWRQKLGTGFKVGVAWQGNRQYRHDYRRSIPLQYFSPLASAGVRIISLQKGETASSAGFPLESLGDYDREPFMDTAAIMRCLDLVVTSDTSIAHLAGALGVRTWVALDSMPEWRWLWDRTDSPWYPTMRLFRQRQYGDWPQVFEDIAAELAKLEK